MKWLITFVKDGEKSQITVIADEPKQLTVLMNMAWETGCEFSAVPTE